MEYDRLGSGLTHDDYLAQVGAYQACRRTVDLVDTLIEKAQALHERSDASERDTRNHRTAIHYASPHWKP